MQRKTTKIIAFANNKGGSGKTTTCSNIGAALSESGKKVLLIDCDMQVNLTLSFFGEDETLGFSESGKNIYTALKEEKDLTDFIVKTAYNGLYIVPSSPLMSSAEYDLFTKMQREFVLKRCLKNVKESGEYDYVLIDAPPTLACLVTNILCASDFVIVPVEASPWGLFGLANVYEFVEKVRRISPALKIAGVAITKADARKNYLRQTIEILKRTDATRLFDTVIHTDSAVEWSQDDSRPVVFYKKNSRAATEYINLSKEIEKICR